MHEAAMSHSTPYGLDASELDELHEYLVAHPGADGLMLDGVHGLLSALSLIHISEPTRPY